MAVNLLDYTEVVSGGDQARNLAFNFYFKIGSTTQLTFTNGKMCTLLKILIKSELLKQMLFQNMSTWVDFG